MTSPMNRCQPVGTQLDLQKLATEKVKDVCMAEANNDKPPVKFLIFVFTRNKVMT